MLNANVEFERRENEIDEYVGYLEKLEKQVGISPTLINTMKSSALLMMYNVIESTMTNLLQDVFDELDASKISFDGLNDTMKALVLTYSKKRNAITLVEKMNAGAVSLVVACFERSDLFSGNIDCAKIRSTLKEIGVKTSHAYREDALLKIKSERNDLAHGNKSFSDCGRDYTAAELRDSHNKIMVILRRVIKDFEEFLNTKAYA